MYGRERHTGAGASNGYGPRGFHSPRGFHAAPGYPLSQLMKPGLLRGCLGGGASSEAQAYAGPCRESCNLGQQEHAAQHTSDTSAARYPSIRSKELIEARQKSDALWAAVNARKESSAKELIEARQKSEAMWAAVNARKQDEPTDAKPPVAAAENSCEPQVPQHFTGTSSHQSSAERVCDADSTHINISEVSSTVNKVSKACEPDWDHLTNEDAIKQSIEQALERCQEAEATAGWESTKPPKGADGYAVSVLTKSKTVTVVQVKCTMNASKGAILDLLKRGQGGPKNAKVQMLQDVSTEASFMHIEVNVPIVKNRDFVCCQYLKQSDGDSCAVLVRTSVPESIATPLCAPNPKCVRGRIVLQCTFVTPVEGDSSQSNVKWISCVDPGGKIAGVKAISATEGAKSMMALHKAAAECEGQKPVPSLPLSAQVSTPMVLTTVPKKAYNTSTKKHHKEVTTIPEEAPVIQAASNTPETAVESTPAAIWNSEDLEESIHAATQQALGRSQQVENGSGWEVAKPPKGCEGYTVGLLQQSKFVHVVKVECTIKASQRHVVGLLTQGKGGPKGTTCDVFRQVNATMCLMHVKVSMTMVKNRDYICCQWVDASQPTVKVVRVSVPDEHAEELQAGYPAKFKRGRLVLQCAYVTQSADEKCCSIKWLSCVDMGGKYSTGKKNVSNDGAKTILALSKAATSAEYTEKLAVHAQAAAEASEKEAAEVEATEKAKAKVARGQSPPLIRPTKVRDHKRTLSADISSDRCGSAWRHRMAASHVLAADVNFCGAGELPQMFVGASGEETDMPAHVIYRVSKADLENKFEQLESLQQQYLTARHPSPHRESKQRVIELKQQVDALELEVHKARENFNLLGKPAASTPPEQKQSRAVCLEDTLGCLPTGTNIEDTHCWTTPPSECFEVRGTSYLKDKKKVKATECMFELVGTDVFKTDDATGPCLASSSEWTDSVYNRSLRNAERLGELSPRFLIVNFMIPGKPCNINMIHYFREKEFEIQNDEDAQYKQLVDQFMSADSNKFRKHRLKLIPICVEGSSMIKKLMGSPTLIAKKLKTYYHCTDNCVECSIDVGSSFIAKQVVGSIKGVLADLVIDLGYVIEGITANELPERLIGGCRLQHVNLNGLQDRTAYAGSDDEL